MEHRERVAELVPRLRRYARALLSAPPAADALVRATLERACELLPRLRREPDLRLWLFGILHDTYVETAYPVPRREAGPADAGPADGGSLTRPDFERAIEALPPEEREVFLLVTLEQMSYEEVARTLDAPLAAVMMRLAYAREQVRIALLSQARLKMVK